MAHSLVAVVGNDNVTNSHLQNVGNRTYNIVNNIGRETGTVTLLVYPNCTAQHTYDTQAEKSLSSHVLLSTHY